MILIVDFGSQTTHLIGKRIRDLGAPVAITDPQTACKKIEALHPKGVILSGGPAGVYDEHSPTIDPDIFSKNIPILGICYGMQITARLLNGDGKPGNPKEYGPAIFHITGSSPLFTGLGQKPFQVWMSHGDRVVRVPDGFCISGHTEDLPIAAMHDNAKNCYCIQFHPEVDHTQFGLLMLRNFLTVICKLKLKKRTVYVSSIVRDIQKSIGKDSALVAVSGGVDSTVAATIVARAIGKKLIPVYIESGLMREGTSKSVIHYFRDILRTEPVIIEAKIRFLKALKGVTDPERKRKAIGKLYIDLFQEEAEKHPGANVLVQGTIYSDVIESKGTNNADKIKSHHNVGGLPDHMNFRLVEPLRTFYKDEVRTIGKKLKLPKKYVTRQVFPGPGYAIRIIGEVTEERLNQERAADRIVLEEMERSGWMKKIFMSFPIMTGAVSTAVKGDGRFYGEVIALRVIQSTNVMTTTWAHLPYSLLQKISSRIVNEVPGVSRVVYDITTKPPATMEWE